MKALNPSKEQQEMARIVEQAVSALVDDDKWVYFIVIASREITTDRMPWVHISSTTFDSFAPVLRDMLDVEIQRRREPQS